MIYIGIDPGKNGGIAILSDTIPDVTVRVFSEDELLHICKTFRKTFSEDCKCVLEKVNAMPNQGVVSMFNFGQNYGFIQGVLKAYEIPYELVTPQKWKKEFSCTSDKNTSIEVCKRLFPGVNLKATDRCRKDHDGMAEALLLACYAKRHML